METTHDATTVRAELFIHQRQLPVDDAVQVRVEEVPKFQGYLGESNNKKAIRIDSRIIEE